MSYYGEPQFKGGYTYAKKEWKRRFANTVNGRKQELGMNQTELAKKVGVSQGSINAYCNMRAIPRADIVVRLAKALEISVSDLIDFAE